MRRIACALGCLVIGLLAGCGGGGGAPGSGSATGGTVGAAFDKYVGTWSACIANSSGSGSHLQSIAFAKTGDTAGTFSTTRLDYPVAGCTGTATTTSATGIVQLTGTKTIGAATVDEAVLTQGANAPQQQVLLVSGTTPATLAMGVAAADGGPVDANGYPTTLDSHPLTKQ